MKKIFVAFLVLAIMSATIGIGYAAEAGGGDKNAPAAESDQIVKKGGGDKNAPAAESDQTVKTTGKETIQQEGKEYLIVAWGRYGPISLSSGYSSWWRINYPGCFLGTPSVQVSLEVPYPWTQKYSIGLDKGYSFPCRFDVRVTSISGSLTGSIINWHARR